MGRRCSVSGPQEGEGCWGGGRGPPLHMHSQHWSPREQEWGKPPPALDYRRKGLVLGAGGPWGIMGGRPGPPPRGEMYVGGAPATGGTGLSRSWFRVSVAGGAGWKGLVTEGPVAGPPAGRGVESGACRAGQHPCSRAALTARQEGVGGLGSWRRGAWPAHQRVQVHQGGIGPQERLRRLPRGRRGRRGGCRRGTPHSLGQRAPDPAHVEGTGTARGHLSGEQLQLPWKGPQRGVRGRRPRSQTRQV